VVIPALDARETIGEVVRRVAMTCPDARVVVVDDGSRDGTPAVAESAGATVIRHPINRGKGRALATGIAAALADGASAIVTLDADGQHSPEAIPELLARLLAGFDLVIGARDRRVGVMPWQRRMTNRLSSWALGMVLRRPIEDAQSGFRAFTRAVADRVQPVAARYEYETEFLYLAGMSGCTIAWVPITTVYGEARSHFRPLRDTARLLAVHAQLAGRMMGRR